VKIVTITAPATPCRASWTLDLRRDRVNPRFGHRLPDPRHLHQGEKVGQDIVSRTVLRQEPTPSRTSTRLLTCSRSPICPRPSRRARAVRRGLHRRAGEVHALVGENGAGKSTLIKDSRRVPARRRRGDVRRRTRRFTNPCRHSKRHLHHLPGGQPRPADDVAATSSSAANRSAAWA